MKRTPNRVVSSSNKETKRRRLIFDIETCPNVGLFWRSGHEISVSHVNITEERRIVCICYKWVGDKKVSYLTWDANKDDKRMLERFLKVLDKADEAIAHNGDRFDIRWIRGRCLKHGLPMPPRIATIDTFKEANKFDLNSRSLAYIANFLGLTKKTKNLTMPEYEELMHGKRNRSRTLLKQMVKYCQNDVVVLEEIFHKLNPYNVPKTSIALTTRECPECGSNHVVVNRYTKTAAGYKKVTFRCVDCGKYHTTARSRFENEKSL